MSAALEPVAPFEKIQISSAFLNIDDTFATPICKRSKSGGGGMILRFPVRRESDSFWEWYRLPILTASPTPS